MFSCEICQIFVNTYFEEHLRAAASALGFITSIFLRILQKFFCYLFHNFIGLPSQIYRSIFQGISCRLIFSIEFVYYIKVENQGIWDSRKPSMNCSKIFFVNFDQTFVYRIWITRFTSLVFVQKQTSGATLQKRCS